METKGNAFPPPAFKSFCARQSTLQHKRCDQGGTADSAAKGAVCEGQCFGQSACLQRSDLSMTGNADEWDLPKDRGDCENCHSQEKRTDQAGLASVGAAVNGGAKRRRGPHRTHGAHERGRSRARQPDIDHKGLVAPPYRYFACRSRTENFGSGSARPGRSQIRRSLHIDKIRPNLAATSSFSPLRVRFTSYNRRESAFVPRMQ